MRKNLLIGILALSMLGCGCSNQANSNITEPVSHDISTAVAVTETTMSSSLSDYLITPAVLDTPVREYGESAGYILMEDDIVVRILYPEGEHEALNNTIESWVNDTVKLYRAEAEGSSSHGDTAELTADYTSFIVNDNWITVKISGLFDKPYLAHPVDIVKTFHASINTGELVTLDDFLLPDGKEILQNKIIDELSIDDEQLDEHLLDLWTLKTDGLEITLKRGDYLPMSDGTVTLFYTYEELKDVISLNGTETNDTIPPQISEEGAEITNITIPTSSVDPSLPMVALTFDDGPSKHTDRLLDIFAANGGKGTFFVVGNIIDNRPETLKRTVAEGHEVAGHSWDHRQLTKVTGEDLINQIMSTRAKIYDLTGIDTSVLRPPYGSYNDEVKQVCKDLGVIIVNWSVDTLDWKYKDADTIYNTIMAEVNDGDIILCHDLHGTTVDAMEMVIPALIEKGYQLVTVSELLEASGKEITAGSVYNHK